MNTSWQRRSLFHALWIAVIISAAPSVHAQAAPVPDPSAAPRLVVTPGINNSVTSLQFSRDDSMLLAGSLGASFLWDVATRQLIRVFLAHSFADPQWGPNDETILSSDSDGYITLYNAATGKVIYTIKAYENSVDQAVFSKDRKTFLTGGDAQAILWETATGKVIRSFPHENLGKRETVDSVAFDEATQTIITCGYPGKIRIWDVSSGQILKTIEGHFTSAGNLWIDEKKRILYSRVDDADDRYQSKTRSWNLDDGRVRGVFPEMISGISSEGDLLATKRKFNDPILYLKNAATLEDVRSFNGHFSRLDCMAFSHNGMLVATGSSDENFDHLSVDATIQLWDRQTEKEIAMFDSSAVAVRKVALDESETTLGLLDEEGVLHFMDLKKGGLRRLKDRNPQSKFQDFIFTPGHPWVVTGSLASPTTCWNYLNDEEVIRFDDTLSGGGMI